MSFDPIQQNKTAYDRIAGNFAGRNAEMLPYLVESADRLLAALQMQNRAGFRVLDLGCGAGRDAAYLSARGVKITGADLSMGMLAEARSRASVPLCQLDMRFLPFAPESFAAVWCQAALLHLPKVMAPQALREAARALLPAGLLHLAVQKGETEGFETRPYESEERYYAHYQSGELESLVRAAGFELIAQGQAEARRTWLWVFARKE